MLVVQTGCIVVGSRFDRALGLINLVLNRLAIDRPHVLFAAAVGIKKINVAFPEQIERLNLIRQIGQLSEFLIVLINLILHPAQVFNGFTFARVELANQFFAAALAVGQFLLAKTAINRTPVRFEIWQCRQIQRFADAARAQN